MNWALQPLTVLEALPALPDLGVVSAVMLGGMGLLAAGIGIFHAGLSAGKFFRAAGETAWKVPQILEDQTTAQKAIAQAGDRQADALEHTADLVPLMEKLQEEREQIGTTLRSVSRELRELKSWVQNGRGTGATTAAGARTNLDVYSKEEVATLLAGKASSTHIHNVGDTGVDGDHTHDYSGTDSGGDTFDGATTDAGSHSHAVGNTGSPVAGT